MFENEREKSSECSLVYNKKVVKLWISCAAFRALFYGWCGKQIAIYTKHISTSNDARVQLSSTEFPYIYAMSYFVLEKLCGEKKHALF